MAEKSGDRISKAEWEKMHKKYKESKTFVTQSVYFGRETFERLLAVPGAVGVRTYFGVNEKDELHPMFIPVDEKGYNIFNDSLSKTNESTIEEYGNPCPPFCEPEGT